MSDKIRDLEHRFIIDGRRYHVLIGRDDAPQTPYLVREDYDVAIFAGPKGDFDGEDPHKVALNVVEDVLKLMPTEPTSKELDRFHEAVLDWVMRHRGVAALAALED